MYKIINKFAFQKNDGVSGTQPQSSARLLGGVLAASLLLSGCGLVQKAGDAKDSVIETLFTTEIRTLHLDFAARAELNPTDDDAAASVILRVYQLSDAKSFMAADYQTLLDQDVKVLAADLLEFDEVLLRSSSSVGLSVPLDKKAEFIGIAGFFKAANNEDNVWKIVLKRDDLKSDTPKLIIAAYDYLSLSPEPKKTLITVGMNRNDSSNNRNR